MSFFWRIFLSAWAIVVIAAVVTFSAVSLLPTAGDEAHKASIGEQMVELVARELERRLAADPVTAADSIATDYQLDFAPVLTIFVVDPGGKDLIGRPLPRPVAAVIGNPSAGARSESPDGLYVQRDGLAGYAVVGEVGYFPLGDIMIRPGGRGLMVGLLVLVSAVVSALLARFIVLPVRRLQAAGQQVAAGDLTVRVAPTVGGRTDEIARLAHDFDVMTERVDGLLKSQQRLMRDVSHELRSPLARLQALLSIASYWGQSRVHA